MRKSILCIFVLAFAGNLEAQNVGIGTNSPTAPLTVVANDTAKGIIQKTGAVEVGFYTNSNAAFVQTWSPTNLSFATGNSSARITIQHSSGFVGIGTPFPTAQLDVNGGFRLRGNGAAEGKLLTSDATGHANWQGPIGFFADLANDQNLANNVNTNIAGYNEEFDEGGNFNPVTGRFIVPEDGLYHVTYNIAFYESSSDDKEVYINVQKNLVTFKSYHHQVTGTSLGGFTNYVGSVLVKVIQGETLSLAVTRIESGGSVLRGGNLAVSTSFSIFKVR
ncbi:MAG: hypothetical protein V4722_11060 [Bacteroidota bacterium]